MLLSCAWCGADLGVVAGPDGEVSHGICDLCKVVQLAAIERVPEISLSGRALVAVYVVVLLMVVLFGWSTWPWGLM